MYPSGVLVGFCPLASPCEDRVQDEPPIGMTMAPLGPLGSSSLQHRRTPEIVL